MEKIRIHAFVRQHTHTNKPNTVAGYFNFNISVNNPLITQNLKKTWVMETVKRHEDLFHQGTKEDKAVLRAHIKRFEQTYLGNDVVVTAGNLYETIETEQLNKSTGETYTQRRRQVVPQASFIAVHDQDLLLVEIHIRHVIHQFFGEEYYIRNAERNYAAMKDHTVGQVVPIGEHQVMPKVERQNKTKLETEREVLAMLGAGAKPTHIAKQVGISRPTVYAIKKRYAV
ncbi:helix-turn-helix domain-containing protein [Vibrio cholerae]|uniref:helix-turn-helix domain-containing protein n=1 Tax=Vibrio cholerae TaxID=666 RepID=UPI003530D383